MPPLNHDYGRKSSDFWMINFWITLISGTPKQKGWVVLWDIRLQRKVIQITGEFKACARSQFRSWIKDAAVNWVSPSRVLLQSLDIFNAQQTLQQLGSLKDPKMFLVLCLAFWPEPYEQSFWPSLAQIFVVLYVALPEDRNQSQRKRLQWSPIRDMLQLLFRIPLSFWLCWLIQSLMVTLDLLPMLETCFTTWDWEPAIH